METISRIAGVMSFVLGIGLMVMIGAMVWGSSSSIRGIRMDPELIIVFLISLFLWAFCWMLAYILFFWNGWVRKITGAQIRTFE